MALSVDSTTNLNLIDAAEATTGWSFTSITKTATSSASREGTNCVGGQVALNTHGYAYHTHGSAVNLTTAGNERVYIWAKCAGAGTEAQDGWKVVIGDGTNTRAYTVGGSDAEPFGAKGWYCLMLDTANLPTPYAGFGSGTPDLTAITEFGFGVYNTVAPSGNALNVFVDVVRYGSGLVVTSGATDDITLADIAADDFSSATGKAYGIIREIQPGVYGIQGDILFGDTAGNSIDWKESESVVIFEDRVAGTGTNTAFKMSGQHSATGTFRTELGVAVSSGDNESGRSGVTFVSANAANQPIDFDFSDTDIEDVFIYGCTFTNLRGGTIAFSSDATNGVSHHISGSNFSGCAQVDTGVTDVRNCLFAATADTDAALLWNSSIDIKNCNFIGNTLGAAVEHPAQGTFSHTNLTYTGNTYDILYSAAASSGVLTINAGGTANPVTSEITNPTGNSVSIVNTKTLTVTVIDQAGAAVASPVVSIRDQSDNSEISQGTGTAGGIYTDATYNYTIDTPVYVRVRKSSTGTRYFPAVANATITDSGLDITVTLTEDGIVT